MQGQGGTFESLMSQTSSFTNTLADNGQVIEQLIDNLNGAMKHACRKTEQFDGAMERLHRLVGELSAEREPIGAAIDALSDGTASLAGLLGQARAPLAGTVDQLNRLAPAARREEGPHRRRAAEIAGELPQARPNGCLRKLLQLLPVRRHRPGVSDLQGRTAVFPWIKQDTGRCAENP